MVVLNLKEEDLKYLKLVGMGAEGAVYQLRDKIIKIYNEPEEHNLKKIKYLCKIQPKIKNTEFIIGKVNIDGEFKGVIQKYFKNYYTIDILDYSMNLNQILCFYIKLLQCIKELTDNNLYPSDLYYKNILIKFINRDVKIIDLDGNGIIIKKEANKKLLQNTLNTYLSTMIESLYFNDLNEEHYITYKDIIKKYPFDDYYKNIILNGELSYKFIIEFIRYIAINKTKLLDDKQLKAKKY